MWAALLLVVLKLWSYAAELPQLGTPDQTSLPIRARAAINFGTYRIVFFAILLAFYYMQSGIRVKHT
jgi:hypothetical protein